jgi:hypothetical protein
VRRTYERTRSRQDGDAAHHLATRLGDIRAELERSCETVEAIVIGPAARDKLVNKAEQVAFAADVLLHTLRESAVTDEALVDLINRRDDYSGDND